MKKWKIWLLLPALALLLLCDSAEAQRIQWESYAAKFVCGDVVEAFYAPGVDGKYKTSVNIHNPHYLKFEEFTLPVVFLKRIVLALPQGSEPLPPTCWFQEVLFPDEAMSVTCRNISDQLALSGLPSAGPLEGFVVLLLPPGQDPEGDISPPRLDVQAVYTGRSRMFPSSPLIRENGVSTFDVETVEPRKVVGDPAPFVFCE